MRISDWSSDVCSSDLEADGGGADHHEHDAGQVGELRLREGEEREQGAGEQRADHRGDAADVGEQDDQQAADGIELAALHRPGQAAEEGACATGDEPGEREDDDLRGADPHAEGGGRELRSEEHTSELQSLMRISYAVFCLKNK